MPLLKKKTLEKAQVDDYLRDGDEVFHCVMTNEIFRDYDEFAERTILCNSMVWSCSMTGKTNLTYEEAQQSEEKAKKLLNDFPLKLRVPMIYIANLTKRTLFSEMADDVFYFIKDHYFIGEQVEACLSGGGPWKDYTVAQVIPPTESDLKDLKVQKKEDEPRHKVFLFRYGLKSNDGNETVTATFIQVRRKFRTFNKENNKLFLKQYVEQCSNGYLGIKKSALETFGIDEMKYEDIFAGDFPTFEVKKPRKVATNGKKVHQETLAKFLSKNNIILPKNDKQKAAEEEIRKKKELEREKEREKRQLEKEKRKQRNIEIGLKLRDWSAPNEDLLLEDHQVLPALPPIRSKINDKLMGDALCVIEFINAFSSIIEPRNYFAGGVTLTTMERILFETKPASSMNVAVEMLLAAIFKFQQLEKVDRTKAKIGVTEETSRSDRCQVWCAKNFGKTVEKLPLDTLTVSEVLRLHLLGSGESISESTAKWRAQYRGGYESAEDPAIQLRLHNPHILQSLALHQVSQLPVADKLKVLNCLVNQLLTYPQLREAIDNSVEEAKNIRLEIRSMQTNERKRQADAESHISHMRRGSSVKDDRKIVLMRENEEKLKNAHEDAVASLHSKAFHKTNLLGYDRAYRGYYKLNSLPGLVLNNEPQNLGSCLPDITHHIPELVGADRDQIVKYLGKLIDDMNSSDKENEPKENGVDVKLSTKLDKLKELLMCSADPTTCVVHSTSQNTPKWMFVDSLERLEELMNTLNKRGIREGELRNTLDLDCLSIAKVVGRTPKNLADTSAGSTLMQTRGSEDIPTVCQTAIDTILDLEERLYSGCLGGIAKGRDEFRDIVENCKYSEIDKLERPRNALVLEDSDEEVKHGPSKTWYDPGAYLKNFKADIDSEDSDLDSDEVLLTQTSVEQKTIKFLAFALVQIAWSIKPNFLLRPLGTAAPIKKRLMKRCNAIVWWEQALLQCTSYSQVLLHCNILEEAIMWSKSTLVVKCKACHRGRDDENILLCDYCNDGYHLYCLKPKLSSVPKGEWYCVDCVSIVENIKAKQQAKKKESSPEEDMDVDSESEIDNTPKECAVCGYPETEDCLNCASCDQIFHVECTNLKRSVRGTWNCNDCKTASSHRRSGRNNETSNALPLNNAALQELLRDVMKHEDGWPFVRPVPKNEVPDYYDIITKPMDFGKIKYKLNMGDYQYDDEVIADCQLVFENCHTYNSSDDEVYKCGARLVKYFAKRCKDFKLDFHFDFDTNDQVEPQRKRIKRTK